MNEDYLIQIDSTIEMVDDDNDRVQLMTRGNFIAKNGNFYIVYKETEATGYEGCTTTVKVAEDESRVTMTRFGPASSQLIIQKGVRHLCHYDVGGSTLTLGVTADEIHNHLTEDGGKVHFSYTLDPDRDTLLSRNSVDITVRRALPAN